MNRNLSVHKYLERLINLDLNDLILYEYIADFIVMEIDLEKKCESRFYEVLLMMLKIVERSFQDMNASDYSYKWLLNAINDTSHYKEIALLIKLTLYLYDLEYFTDPRFNRINVVYPNYKTTPAVDKLVYILHDDYFEEFQKKGFFKEFHGRLAYFNNIQGVDFTDIRYKCTLEGFLREYKVNSEKTLSLLSSVLIEFNKFICEYISAMSKDDYCYSGVINVLEKCTTNYPHEMFIKYLVYCIEKGYFYDDNELSTIQMYERLNYCILKSVTRRKLILIIKNGLFYHEKALNEGRLKKTIPVLNIHTFSFEDKENKRLILIFVENYIASNEIVLETKYHTLKRFENFVDDYLRHFTIEEYTSENIIRLLKVNDSLIPVDIFIRFVFFLSEHINIMNDKNLAYLSNYKKDILALPGIRAKDVVRLLSSSHIEKFKFLYAPNKSLIYINSEHEEIRSIIAEFISQKAANLKHSYKYFASSFRDSLGDIHLENYLDLNDHTFYVQLDFYKVKGIEQIRVLINFYLFVSNHYNSDIFLDSTLIREPVLHRFSVTRELLDGFKFTLFSPYTTYPDYNKWLFYYASFEGANTSKNNTSSLCLDFTQIKNQVMREHAKFYFWNHKASVRTRYQGFLALKSFSNYREYFFTNKQIVTLGGREKLETITGRQIITFKSYLLEKRNSNSTVLSTMAGLRMTLQYLADFNGLNVDKNAFFHATLHKSEPVPANPVTDNHLRKLSDYIKEMALDNHLYQLYYSIFYLLLETQLRLSEIIRLQHDCIKPSMRANQYLLVTENKVFPTESVELAISLYTKRHIEFIQSITSDDRKKCRRKDIVNYLYLTVSNKKAHKILRDYEFSEYLKNCCLKLGIPKYTASNLRDTHMTKSVEYIIKNNLSDTSLKVLSGHASITTTTKHYVSIDIIKMLESVHGVIIGNITPDGQVLSRKPENLHNENSVSYNCGLCSAKKCNVKIFIDCFLCKHFVTWPEKIPYFEEQLRILDDKLLRVQLSHDKEDIINVKRLILWYLSQLYSIGEKINE
ncbi:site-specific integrase [Vallitalea guaymasensis]|uniref:site-specific integrase n=1 Tax=Vallitalea guaymasensis TaxID=1185412 RepID=UPI000DE4B8E2|nr:site-specific integrase [Vallitalea guaymasensis]